jgi:hypothetical protein
MAITLNKLSYDLLNSARGGKVSSSEQISLRQVKEWVKNTRILLIQRELDKHRSVSQNIISDLGCVNVSLVDASSCCGITVDCNILRTDVKIPNPIETAQKDMLTRVASSDLTSIGYTIIPYQRAAHTGNGQFTKLGHYAFMHDNYVYVMGPKSGLFKRINIQGVFEDPTESATFTSCSGEACYTDDSKYPISGKHVEILKQMIFETNFRIAIQGKTDVTGDGKHNPEQVTDK